MTFLHAGLTSASPSCRPLLPARKWGTVSSTNRSNRRHRTLVKAQQQPQQDGQSAIGQVLERFSKYDFLSTGLGAACVTSVCVAQGQDPFFALWITFCATVAALAVNEVFEES